MALIFPTWRLSKAHAISEDSDQTVCFVVRCPISSLQVNWVYRVNIVYALSVLPNEWYLQVMKHTSTVNE